MKKSKIFILKRERGRWLSHLIEIKYTTGRAIQTHYSKQGLVGICYKTFSRFFGVKVPPGEQKRIRITIEEIK